jgi:hypothetical protein
MHRVSRRFLAHRDEQVRLEFSFAIGGAADMDGRAAQPETGANDPKLSIGRQICRAAQRDIAMW